MSSTRRQRLIDGYPVHLAKTHVSRGAETWVYAKNGEASVVVRFPDQNTAIVTLSRATMRLLRDVVLADEQPRQRERKAAKRMPPGVTP